LRSLARNFATVLKVISRTRFFIMLSLMVAAALLEVTVVGLFFPYLDILLNPEKIQSSQLGSYVYDTLSLSSTDQFLRVFGGVLIGVVIVSAIVGASSRVFITRYTWSAYTSLTSTMYRVYLSKPYIRWRESNSDVLAKNVINEVTVFTNGLLTPVSEFLARVIVLTVWVVLLVIVDPLVAFAAIGVIGGIYFTIFATMRRHLAGMAEQRFRLLQQIFEYVNSSFRSIKDIKVSRAESMFAEKIQGPARQYANVNKKIAIIAQVPRYGIEAVVFLVAIMVLLSSVGSQDLAELIPLLSLYTMAGFRMLPHAQALFSAATRIKFNIKSLDVLAEQLGPALAEPDSHDIEATQPFKTLRADNVSYRFPGADSYVFRDADFQISAGEIVFVQGKSGLGKSTLAELLLGLLTPTSGTVLCNDVQLEPGRVLSTRINVGYVSPESILFEGTLHENISLHRALNVTGDWLDRAIDAACAREIADSLGGSEGWISEGGKNLSAGQRQRLGLVRALCGDPDLLVLDEATNALDAATEALVIANVRALGIAVVIITHQDSLYAIGDTAYDFRSLEELPPGQSLDQNALSEVSRRVVPAWPPEPPVKS
jgi:ABC-type bacteriocin/lantibiotic exporter with double-glycine peptidase domain